MKLGGFTGGIYQISVWVMRFSLTNLLWILFTIIGLGIFGLFPATTAMFTIWKKLRNKEHEFSFLKLFWETYRKQFINSNLIGLIIMIIGTFLYFDFKILNLLDGVFFRIIEILLIAVTIFFLIVVIYIFPVIIHYKAGILSSIKNALFVGILAPLSTVSIFLSSLIIIYISLSIPSLFIFFTASILCFLNISFTSRELKKIDQRVA